MQTVDRRGIHLEQCSGCRGIFLDRGELEQIVNAEQSYHTPAAPAAPPAYAPPPAAPGYPAPPVAPGYPAGNVAFGAAPAAGYPAHGGHVGQGHYRDSPPAYGHHRDSPPHYGHHGHKKRKSFVEELFG